MPNQPQPTKPPWGIFVSQTGIGAWNPKSKDAFGVEPPCRLIPLIPCGHVQVWRNRDFFLYPKKGGKKQSTPNKKGTFVSKRKRKKATMKHEYRVYSLYSLHKEILLEDGVSFFNVFFCKMIIPDLNI